MRHLSFPISFALAATLATGCGGGGARNDASPDLSAPGSASATREFIAIQMLFARQIPAGTSVGFDLDGYTAADGDPKTCGHASLVSPTGEKGIDNQMSVFVAALDKQYDHAVDDIIQGGIDSGMLVLGIRLGGVDDPMNDPSVSLEILRLHGTPIIGTDKRLVADQTFDAAPGTPLAAGDGAITDGVFQSARFDMRLPVQLLTADFNIRLRNALLRVPLAKSLLTGDVAPAVLGGTVESQNMLDGLLPLQLDEGFKARMPALFAGLADEGKDAASGHCLEFSAAINLPLRTAFIAGTSAAPDAGSALGCAGLLLCLQACKANSACEQACFARTTPTGMTRFDALGACTEHVCEPPLIDDGGLDDAGVSEGGVPDGGPYACRFHDDPSDSCRGCLASAAQSQACRPQFSDCFADP